MTRDRQYSLLFVSVVVCLWTLQSQVSVADYVLEIKVTSYSNPTNQRLSHHSTNPCCCDGRFRLRVCTRVHSRCDNQFFYCLRPHNTSTTTRGCTKYKHTETSNVGWDGVPINFSQSTVLGLPNPMNLTGLDTFWRGVQLHIEVLDNDGESPGEFVDSFSINMNENTTKGSYLMLPDKSGTYNLAAIGLSARFLCAENYYGERCERFDYCSAPLTSCSGHGVCSNFIVGNGYTCDCEPGYTGTECGTDIDECLLTEPECSGHGRCTGGVNSFTCDCDQGFTGLLCEINIDECDGVNCSVHGQCVDGVNNFTCVCQSGYMGDFCTVDVQGGLGGSSGGIIGGVVGGLVAVILAVLLLTLLVVLVMVAVRKRRVQVTQGIMQTSPCTPGDNPVYGAQNTVIIKHSVKSNTAEFDNPIYDIEEAEYEIPITTRQPTTIPPLYSALMDEHTEQTTGKYVSDTDSNTVEFDTQIYHGDNDIEGPEYMTLDPRQPNPYEVPAPLYSTVTDDVQTRPQMSEHEDQQVYQNVIV